ncbi:hypothetical protein [Micromonospora profundi]|uniref:hypothetical protein n=1 Tax=Micromonospora TaxID=1873 RepID=UPI0033BF87CC
MESDQQSDDRLGYARDRDWIAYAIHELPVGVLWGPDGATAEQCAELLDGLDEFATVCDRLGLGDHAEFIENCRWHFEHYAHYLGRRRHFVDYGTYVRDRHGPMSISPPPPPYWLGSR